MYRLLIIIYLLLLFINPFQSEARDNPFVSKKAPAKEVRLPTIVSKVFAKIIFWQGKLNTKLTKQVKLLKKEKSWASLFPLILISFLYGVIHAAGPGHGKVVVFSYFISRRSSIKKGLMLGNLISLFHALSGILIVLILYFIIKTAYMSSFEAISLRIKLVSYGLIVLMGLMLFVNGIFNITDRISPQNKKDSSNKTSLINGILPLALAVGMVPCPGVVIIMLFTIFFDLMFTGIIMSFVRALGMAATISFAGLLSILGQEGIINALSRKERAQFLVQKGMSISGSMFLIVFGCVLFAGI